MKILTLISLTWLSLAVGCTDPTVTEKPTAVDSQSQSQYVADSEPAGAMPVGEARQSVADDQSIVLVGRIGGSTQPFVDGLAAFTIVDLQVPHCAADEGCPTPWDYCCTQDQVKENIATVKIVDSAGQPIANDARQLLDVKELSTVVVEGKAKRDDVGNLTVVAQKVFVRPAN